MHRALTTHFVSVFIEGDSCKFTGHYVSARDHNRTFCFLLIRDGRMTHIPQRPRKMTSYLHFGYRQDLLCSVTKPLSSFLLDFIISWGIRLAPLGYPSKFQLKLLLPAPEAYSGPYSTGLLDAILTTAPVITFVGQWSLSFQCSFWQAPESRCWLFRLCQQR